MARFEDYPTTFIPGMIREGVSATEGLRRFRDGGGRIRTSTWYTTWGQIVAGLAKEADVINAPSHRRPDRSLITEWSNVRGPGFIYQGLAYNRFKGTDMIGLRPVSIRTKTLISMGRAIDQMTDFMLQGEDEYGETVLGVTLTGVFELTGE